MILVTGGTGLVGSHILLDLCRAGKPVKALVRKGSDTSFCLSVFRFWEKENGEELFNSILWVDGDVTDTTSLEAALENCRSVVHAAAVVSFRRSDDELLERINVDGTANLVNACLEYGVQEFCHISSVAAIGKSKDAEVLTESTPWKSGPEHSPYALSKFRAEQEVWRGSEEGLKVLILNPGVVLGPGDPNRSSTVIFERIRNGNPFYSTGINGFTDVRDISMALTQLMDKQIWGERFIIVGENVSYENLIVQITNAFGIPKPKYELKPWMLRPAVLIFSIRDLFASTPSGVSMNSLRSTMKKVHYSSKKLNEQLNLPLQTMEEIISLTAEYLKGLSAEKR